MPQNPPREEEIQPSEIPFKIKDDLFNVDFGKSLNFQPHKRPSREYNSNPLKKGSLRKRPYSHVGHLEKPKYGMTSDAIEGEPSHFEANPIFSPSMPPTNVSFEPVSEPILDPNDTPDVLFPKSHDNPRNPLRQPKHGSHEGHKDDLE